MNRTPLAAAIAAVALVAGGAGVAATSLPDTTVLDGVGADVAGPATAVTYEDTQMPTRGLSSFYRLEARRMDSAALPPSGEELGFLGVIDLPSVPGIGGPWVGTPPADVRRNPSATPCDTARFAVQGVRQEQVRTFLVPRARRLPATFGLSETIGRFPSPRSADSFVDQVKSRVASCEDRISSATVHAPSRVRAPDLTGTTWNLTFELEQGALRYRMGLIRLGDRVAQVAFSPTGAHEIPRAAFDRLVKRAGQRLAELGRG